LRPIRCGQLELLEQVERGLNKDFILGFARLDDARTHFLTNFQKTNLAQMCKPTSPETQHVPYPRRSSLKREGSNKRFLRASVSFDRVHIRLFKTTLGEQNVCSSGAPLTLGWEFEAETNDDINVVEFKRHSKGSRNLDRESSARRLILSEEERYLMLQKAGYSDEDIWHAEQDVAKVRHQRYTTLSWLPTSRLEAVLESAGRKLRRVKMRRQEGAPPSPKPIRSVHKRAHTYTGTPTAVWHDL
jgi:hypothetical protein